MRNLDWAPIGHIESVHRAVADAPSQSSETDTPARVVVHDAFVDGMLGLERYEFLWLITWLDQQPDDRPLRVVPRTTEATGELQGVFASRYPYRPNEIGLSLVRVLGVAPPVIDVQGADLLDGTSVLDIKPWFADCDDPRALPG